jgi:PTS system sorbose-specific IID component
MENTSTVETKKDIYAQSQLTKKDLMTTFVFSNFL